MQTKPESQVYAGFFVRLAAYLIDSLIVGVALLVIRIPLWITTFGNPDHLLVRDFIFQYSIADIVLYLAGAAYFVLLTYFTGSTLGKKLLQLRVVSAENRDLTFFEVLYRETVGKFLSGLIIGIGYLMIGPDKQKKGLHDILADTRVIYYHERKVYVRTPIVYREMNAGYIPAPSPNQMGGKVPAQPMAQPMADGTKLQQMTRSMDHPELKQSETEDSSDTEV